MKSSSTTLQREHYDGPDRDWQFNKQQLHHLHWLLVWRGAGVSSVPAVDYAVRGEIAWGGAGKNVRSSQLSALGKALNNLKVIGSHLLRGIALNLWQESAVNDGRVIHNSYATNLQRWGCGIESHIQHIPPIVRIGHVVKVAEIAAMPGFA